MNDGKHKRLRQGRRTSSREDDGPRVFTVTSSDIARCPKQSLAPAHYRDDGTCLCDEDEENTWD